MKLRWTRSEDKYPAGNDTAGAEGVRQPAANCPAGQGPGRQWNYPAILGAPAPDEHLLRQMPLDRDWQLHLAALDRVSKLRDSGAGLVRASPAAPPPTTTKSPPMIMGGSV